MSEMKTIKFPGDVEPRVIVDRASVHYTEQELTEEQKAQARENIGALASEETVGGYLKVEITPDAWIKYGNIFDTTEFAPGKGAYGTVDIRGCYKVDVHCYQAEASRGFHGIHFYDESGAMISAYDIGVTNGWATVSVDVPAGAITMKVNANPYWENERVSVYGYRKMTVADMVEEAMERLQPTYVGKKILFMGDSITHLAGERGWTTYFNEILKPSLSVNIAVSSAKWCDNDGTVYDGNPVFNGADNNTNNVMGNQVEKLLRGKDTTHANYSHVADYDDFDIIMIAAGTNDSTPSGNIEPSFTANNAVVSLASLDRKVFASAFRYVIENLQTMYPNAKIYICTPIQGWITTRTYESTKARGDYLKQLAGRMSLEVVDTFECGICGLYEAQGSNGRDLIDGLHPNVNGAKKIGKYNAKRVSASYI